jgi:hypothetical protein
MTSRLQKGLFAAIVATFLAIAPPTAQAAERSREPSFDARDRVVRVIAKIHRWLTGSNSDSPLPPTPGKP